MYDHGNLVVNLSRAKERVIETLTHAERPIYLILLVFAGAIWRVGDPMFFLLALVYLIVRSVGKLVGGYISVHGFAGIPSPGSVGLALISQGGIAVAIVVNFQQAYQSEVTNAVMTIVLLATVINELISPYLARRVFDHYEGK